MPGPTLPVSHPSHQIAKKRRLQQYTAMYGKREGAVRLAKADQLHVASRHLLVHGSGSIGDAAKRGALLGAAWRGSNVIGVSPAVQ